ncbi:MAG: hypothetical protein ACRD4H_09770 [Candidatus Acidiferrales bacterium]
MVGLYEPASSLKYQNTLLQHQISVATGFSRCAHRADTINLKALFEQGRREARKSNPRGTVCEKFINLKKYHNEFQDRLKQLIESKQEDREVAPVPQPHRAPVIDMMEALKKSLAASGASHKKPMHAATTELHRRGTRRAAS